MDESQEKSHYSNFFSILEVTVEHRKKATQGAEQKNNPQEHRRVTGKSFIGDIKVVITPPIENIQRKGSENRYRRNKSGAILPTLILPVNIHNLILQKPNR